MSGRPAVSLVVVTFRSSGVLPAALAAFRQAAAELGGGVEVVVVDHSEDPAELARLAALRPDHLLARPNRGYAAGLNTGIELARGEVLLLANPDVEPRPGALAALVAALDTGCDVAGPQFELAGFRFPPADPQSPGSELHRALASRSPAVWRRLLALEVRRWRQVWESAEPVAVPTLSGALLAVRAATARRLGPWDEGFFLYFEETDWLRRARAAGFALAVVPAARAEHAWGHATLGAADGSFARSRARYLAKHFGRRGVWAHQLADGMTCPGSDLPAAPLPGDLPEGALLLASPLPLGLPAALAPAGAAPAASLARFARAARLDRVTALAWDPRTEAPLGPWSVDAKEEAA